MKTEMASYCFNYVCEKWWIYILQEGGDNMNELYHYGILGMKWGVRRYQNKDGSLTPQGKKRYSSMSNNQLQKELYKQVKEARAQQYGSANKWGVSKTIGKHSKSAAEKYSNDYRRYTNTEQYKSAQNKIKNLDRRYNQGKIDPDTYDKEYAKIRESVYDPRFDTSVRISNGRKYVQAYIDSYGKDLNIGYLRDLGYDESTAKALAERVDKANKRMLNGM